MKNSPHVCMQSILLFIDVKEHAIISKGTLNLSIFSWCSHRVNTHNYFWKWCLNIRKHMLSQKMKTFFFKKHFIFFKFQFLFPDTWLKNTYTLRAVHHVRCDFTCGRAYTTADISFWHITKYIMIVVVYITCFKLSQSLIKNIA